MTFSKFLASTYPCQENGVESLVGAVYIFGVLVMTVMYLKRERNRRYSYIRKVLGIRQKMIESDESKPHKMVIIWYNVILFILIHMGFFTAIYLFIFVTKWKTLLFSIVVYELGGFSTTAGAHRLYTHRTYKATKLYEIVVMILHSMLMHNDIIHWARDHRTHHKFTDTTADPHTPHCSKSKLRGLFFAQIGWLMVERHPDVIKQGKKVDISDLTSNPILAFQRKYYVILLLTFGYFIPIVVPQIFWAESYWASFFCCMTFPFCLSIHTSGVVNSICHYAGNRPYSKNSTASDGIGPWPNILTAGEAHHNFHHAFPHDYRISPYMSVFNVFANVIYLCSWLGLTYDLKMAPQAMIDRARLRNIDAKELLFY